MEENVVRIRMDEQGRIVIPAAIRKQLDTKELELQTTPGELILRRADTNNEELEDWYERVLNTAPEPRPSDDKTKWSNDDYNKHKLGL